MSVKTKERFKYKKISKGNGPAYRQLVNQVLHGIEVGTLAPGDKLPPENELADTIGLSRMTINHAYRELQGKGIVNRTRKRGTFVSAGTQNIKKGTLGICLPLSKQVGASSPIQADYMYGFQQACEARVYVTALSYVGEGAESETLGNLDGACFMTNKPPKEKTPGIPSVFLMGWSDGTLKFDWIHTDNAEGGRIAAEHLISLGHRKIACYAERYYHGGIMDRIESFCATIRENGLQIPTEYLPKPLKNRQNTNLIKLLKSKNCPTAIFSISDPGGLTILNCARDLGISVPGDLSVMTFDGSSLLEHASPRLTTVFADRVQAGKRAALTLIGRIEGTMKGAPREIITPVYLRKGDSTKKFKA